MKTEIEVSLSKRSGQSLGLVLVSVDGKELVVHIIKPGLVEEWNTSCDLLQCIKVGDSIVGVNGVRDDAKRMLSLLKSESSFKLAVDPYVLNVCNTFQARLIRSESTKVVGLKIGSPSGEFLRVLQIRSGLAKIWNESTDPTELQILPGTKIIDVNGVKGGKQMMHILQEAKVLILTLKHPSPDECLPPPPDDVDSTTYDIYSTTKGDFQALIVKSGCVAAAGLQYGPHSPVCLRVKHVLADGPVQEWNDKNGPEYHILPGDTIVDVNGICGSDRMLAIIQNARVLVLTIQRVADRGDRRKLAPPSFESAEVKTEVSTDGGMPRPKAKAAANSHRHSNGDGFGSLLVEKCLVPAVAPPEDLDSVRPPEAMRPIFAKVEVELSKDRVQFTCHESEVFLDLHHSVGAPSITPRIFNSGEDEIQACEEFTIRPCGLMSRPRNCYDFMLCCAPESPTDLAEHP